MRFSVRGTILLLALYVAICVGFVLWSWRLQRESSAALMEVSARAVAAEVARVLDEEAGHALLLGDSEARRRGLRRFRELVADSAVVEGVEVVDADGEIFASDDFVAIGRTAPTVAELFPGDLSTQLHHSPKDPARYDVIAPLRRDGMAIGYLRVRLRFTELSDLVRQSTTQLLFASLLGVAAVSVAGLVLQGQLRRRLTELQQALDAALAGGPPSERLSGGPDEFSAALATAGRLGRELQAERARTSAAGRRLARVAHLVDVGVLLLGPATDIEFASDRAVELFGEPAETQPRVLQERIASLRERLAAAPAGAPVRVEIEVANKKLSIQAHRLDDRGEGGWLVLVRDRELVNAVESDLRMAAQLRGLTRLYMGVAHDLKAPLNAMVLNLELLRRSIDRPWIEDEDERRDRELDWARVVGSELDRLRRSLDTLLAQTAPPREDAERFDLCDVLAEIVALLGPQARQQRIRLDSDCAVESVPITGHRDQIKQAILNVAINGLEATNEAGQLALTLHVEDAQAVVRVVDSGPGIPSEVIARVFDMRFSTKPKGSGIGLWVARSIVESQGGSLEVEHTGSDGTTFAARLPLLTERT